MLFAEIFEVQNTSNVEALRQNEVPQKGSKHLNVCSTLNILVPQPDATAFRNLGQPPLDERLRAGQNILNIRKVPLDHRAARLW
jgi:hypothetical protein